MITVVTRLFHLQRDNQRVKFIDVRGVIEEKFVDFLRD